MRDERGVGLDRPIACNKYPLGAGILAIAATGNKTPQFAPNHSPIVWWLISLSCVNVRRKVAPSRAIIDRPFSHSRHSTFGKRNTKMALISSSHF